VFDKIANWLIARAKKTPYFHLPSYMNRWWLVPYRAQANDSQYKTGTYNAVWYREPFKWLLQRFDIAIRVHEILTSDDRDRGFHDHPWPYITIILKGGYIEVTPIYVDGIYTGERRKYYAPGSILFRRAQSWHSLELPYATSPLDGDVMPNGRGGWQEEPCTTLFITFKYVQKWGFLVEPRGKQYYRDVFAQAAAKLPEIR